jgi:PadR family transcriptional regulator, regulatory protein PadR
MKQDWTRSNLDVLLLGILSERAAHGYQVIQKLRESSDGVFDLPEGTVYPSLHRLEKAGVLRSRWDTVAGRRRRIYEITPSGTTVLEKGRKAWGRYCFSVNAVLGLSA